VYTKKLLKFLLKHPESYTLCTSQLLSKSFCFQRALSSVAKQQHHSGFPQDAARMTTLDPLAEAMDTWTFDNEFFTPMREGPKAELINKPLFHPSSCLQDQATSTTVRISQMPPARPGK
jgi:hypothetical protein